LLRFARNDGKLSILPFRLALLDEGANAFLGVARHHVLGHHLGGVAIGLGKGRDRVLTCDLTKEYVAINGDYRS